MSLLSLIQDPNIFTKLLLSTDGAPITKKQADDNG